MPDFKTTIFRNERVYMVDFVRAISGRANRQFPDVDNTGYQNRDVPAEHGPIVSAMVQQERVTVAFLRTEISETAKLFAVSLDPAVMTIINPGGTGLLQGARRQNIEFNAVAEGRTAIEIRYNWQDGPVIGRLYVQVYSRLEIRMFIQLLEKVKSRPQPRRLLGKDCPTDRDAVSWIEQLFELANDTWMPHGIVFTPSGAVVGETGQTNKFRRIRHQTIF